MVPTWMTELGLEFPVVQAGMGGEVANARLALAVSRAGGLGTLALEAPAAFRASLHLLKTELGRRPFAANLLMPFVRPAHVDACLTEKPAVVVLFLGRDASLVSLLQAAGIHVWQQIGTVAQAEAALDDGVEALIVQGVEAGGHLAADVPLANLLPAVRARFPETPLLAAGGIFDADSTRVAHHLGADGVVAGTRFLLTPESGAHAIYKQRLLEADTTLRTQLFGLAWPAWHRVATNAATQRWAQTHAAGPLLTRLLYRLTVPLRRLIPMDAGPSLLKFQRLSLPFFSPLPVAEGMDASVIDTTPLYAGTCVQHIHTLLPAAEVVHDLAQGFIDPH